MATYFVQNIDLRNKSYKQFLVKKETGAARKILFLTFFSIKFFFVVLLQVYGNSISLNKFKSYTYCTRKICKVGTRPPKKRFR